MHNYSLIHPLDCSGDIDSLQQHNPLYEERELKMEMFEVSDDETDGKSYANSICPQHPHNKVVQCY